MDGSYSVWNSLSILEKEWNLQGWSTKTPHSLGIFLYFGLGVFKGCSTLYGSSLAMTFEISRISKTNLTSVKCLKRHFLDHHAYFYLEQTTDRQIGLYVLGAEIYTLPFYCTGLVLLPELPQNKICFIFHSKYTCFSCFPIICSSAIWKSLF